MSRQPSGEDSAGGGFIPGGITPRCVESPALSHTAVHTLSRRKITYALHARYAGPNRRQAPVGGPDVRRNVRPCPPRYSGSGRGQAVRVEGRVCRRAPSPAGRVTFTVTNAGSIPHAFEVEGQGIERETDAHPAGIERHAAPSPSSPGPTRCTARSARTRTRTSVWKPTFEVVGALGAGASGDGAVAMSDSPGQRCASRPGTVRRSG